MEITVAMVVTSRLFATYFANPRSLKTSPKLRRVGVNVQLIRNSSCCVRAPSIVDHQVEAADLAHGGCHHGPHLGVAGSVRLHHQTAGAAGASHRTTEYCKREKLPPAASRSLYWYWYH